MATSPATENYTIGKAKLYFTPTAGTERALGNAPEAEFTPATDTLDHFSSMAGVRSKDKSVVVEKSATLRMVLDEITAKNLQMLMVGGDITTVAGPPEVNTFAIFAKSEITGAIRLDGTNDIGNKVSGDFPEVSIKPTGSFNFISDEWQQMEVTADVLLQTHSDGSSDFGTISVEEAAAA